MFTNDIAASMVGSIAEAFSGAAHQRRAAHFYLTVSARVSRPKRFRVAAMVETIHVMKSCEVAETKTPETTNELRGRQSRK